MVIEGKLSKDGNTLSGSWVQKKSYPFELKRVDAIPGPNRPQTPQKPYAYLEEEISYPNPEAKIQLSGTLTLPKGKGPFPAVILLPGSGRSDRDETHSFHKPFMVLADHLTRYGIAVLRSDKRGCGKSY